MALPRTPVDSRPGLRSVGPAPRRTSAVGRLAHRPIANWFGASAVSLLLCGAILVTSGAMAWWALILTLFQAAAMVLCSRDLKVGWALGLAMQAPWITYDIATRQYPFIATGLIVSAAQITALRRLSARGRERSEGDLHSVTATAPLHLVRAVEPYGERETR